MSTLRGREGRGVERPAFPGARKGARVFGSVALATEQLHEPGGLPAHMNGERKRRGRRRGGFYLVHPGGDESGVVFGGKGRG